MTEEEKTKMEKELSEKFGSKVTITIDKYDRDYSKDPLLVKKLEKAKEIWGRIKFPEGFFDKKPAIQG